MILRAEGVKKKIKGQQILENISFTFESGVRYGIVGFNGCGKTMFLRSLCGFLKLDDGSVTLDGTAIGGATGSFITNAGVVIGETQFPGYLTGYENLRFIADIKKTVDDSDITDILEKVGLLDARDKKYSRYSMGMKQRLRIAQAIMEKPDIIILDEPFNGLDKQAVSEIREILDNYVDDSRMMILTSHNEQDISMLCDVVIEMDGGAIINVKDNER